MAIRISQPEFHARKPMQILIHPIWWAATSNDASQTLAIWRDGHVESIEDSMEANCAIYRKRGREAR